MCDIIMALALLIDALYMATLLLLANRTRPTTNDGAPALTRANDTLPPALFGPGDAA
jgi:hypothetical protein